VRRENAAYLTTQLAKIPGSCRKKLYPGCTGNAWHLYMLRYQPEKFAGLSRAKFLKALSAEGIPASAGYSAVEQGTGGVEHAAVARLQTDPSRNASRCGKEQPLSENDRLCEEAVWFTQNLLLTDKRRWIR